MRRRPQSKPARQPRSEEKPSRLPPMYTSKESSVIARMATQERVDAPREEGMGPAIQRFKLVSGAGSAPADSILPDEPNERHIQEARFERRVFLALADLLLVNWVLYVSLVGRYGPALRQAPMPNGLFWFPALCLIWLISAKLMGLYDEAKTDNLPHTLVAALQSSLITGGLYLLIPFVTPSFPTRRSEAAGFLLMLGIVVPIWRFVFARTFAHPGFSRRALAIGAGWAGVTLAQTLAKAAQNRASHQPRTGMEIIGFIDDDPQKSGKVIEGLPVLGTRYELVELVKKLRPDDLVLAITNSEDIDGGLFQMILDCREFGVNVVRMQTVFERLTGQVPLEHAGRNLEVVLPFDQTRGHTVYLTFREIIDILLAVPLCLLLALFIPVIWLANRIASPGPLFFTQDRVGKAGKVFKVLKFRSMVIGAERQSGPMWAREKDDRITPIGRLLRKTRLDELPQVWNVLAGDMSIIGPRPERPFFVDRLASEIPFYRLRHAIKPGITGWAQVNYRYGASIEDSLAKLRYDFYYIKNQRPFLDLAIIVKTIKVVFGFQGR